MARRLGSPHQEQSSELRAVADKRLQEPASCDVDRRGVARNKVQTCALVPIIRFLIGRLVIPSRGTGSGKGPGCEAKGSLLKRGKFVDMCFHDATIRPSVRNSPPLGTEGRS